MLLSYPQISFNSKMVRLIGGGVRHTARRYLMFQFQNGSINSRGSVCFSDLHNGFNSKMVRLIDDASGAEIAGAEVSIPKWFD